MTSKHIKRNYQKAEIDKTLVSSSKVTINSVQNATDIFLSISFLYLGKPGVSAPVLI